MVGEENKGLAMFLAVVALIAIVGLIVGYAIGDV
jgi:hypothetical protein